MVGPIVGICGHSALRIPIGWRILSRAVVITPHRCESAIGELRGSRTVAAQFSRARSGFDIQLISGIAGSTQPRPATA